MTTSLGRKPAKRRLLKRICRNWVLYLFVLPSVLYIIIFNYVPLYGIQLAFKNFSAAEGIWGSPWVGFDHFERFFQSYQFWDLIRNTLTLSIYSLCMNFPIPIILALLLNYSVNPKFKKFTQTITYAPYFISVVVLVGMINVFFSPDGPINQILMIFGMEEPILFMGNPSYFKHIFVWSGVWRQAGWGSIIYIATLAGVSPELHEAAIVDGANKLQRIFHVDLPSIIPTAVIMLIIGPEQIDWLRSAEAYNQTGLTNNIVLLFWIALTLTADIVILLNGVRMFVGELMASFKGISEKLLPGAVAGVDCAAIFAFAPKSVVLGLIFGFIGQIVGLLLLLIFKSPIFLVPGFIPLFFDNATIAIFANKFGGWKAAMIICIVNGIIQILGSALAIGMMDMTWWQGSADYATIWVGVIGFFKWIGSMFGIPIAG